MTTWLASLGENALTVTDHGDDPGFDGYEYGWGCGYSYGYGYGDGWDDGSGFGDGLGNGDRWGDGYSTG